PLLMEKFMSGKILNIWRHKLASKIARKIYLPSEEKTLALHAEIGNLLFNEITKSDDEDEVCTRVHKNYLVVVMYRVEMSSDKPQPFFPPPGDYKLLKEVTLCNFDFLLAAVRTISVSYLRSILEHARCYILDRDVELIYYTIRKASDVLTRDTLQLGTQIICWLRKIQDSSPLMCRMVLAAMAWCDGYTDPLLVPLNSWLQPPLPLQIKTLNVGAQINLIETTPNGQHVIVVPHDGDPQMWRIMANSLVHTFKGHSGKILCIYVSKCPSDYFLISGSDDTSIIIWDMNTYEIKLRIKEHIAPVSCIVPALNNTLLISGGEDSRIIITSMQTKEVLVKIDHHRGPVTSIRITFPGDVLVSGSTDGSVCLWSLDDYTLLNTVSLPSPISMLSVSSDSVFLLIACENNQMYLYTLATGTEIHCLKGHKSKVKSICLANDNQRAVAVGLDGRIYVYDLHSGHLCRIISTPHNTPLTNVLVTDKDDFLITSGGTRLTFWSFRKEDNELGEEPELPRKSSTKRPHSSPISCLDVSRDGTVAVTACVNQMHDVKTLDTVFTMTSLTCDPTLSLMGILEISSMEADTENLLFNLSSTAAIIMDEIFDKLKQEQPGFLSKVTIICGDCSKKKLGISDENLKLLQTNVNVIFHTAAIVNFEASLAQAVLSNVCATKEFLELATSFGELETFVFVSTAYSNGYKADVDEKVNPTPIGPHEVIHLCETMSEAKLAEIVPRMIKIYNKMEKLTLLLKSFTMCQWNFDDTNVQRLWQQLEAKDQKLFPFNVKDLDWDDYVENNARGIRLYVLQDKNEHRQFAKRRYLMLRAANAMLWTSLTTMLVYGLSWLDWKLLRTYRDPDGGRYWTHENIYDGQETSPGYYTVRYGSEDKRIIVWDVVKGVALSSLQLHHPILALALTTDLSRAAVHLFESWYLPVVCLHNTPATYVSIPVHVPAKEIDGKNERESTN
ncbi:uncharacterized protein LOC103517582, partial [Diaphorina citri]|uniref:Uncharacterized protein LOC103517582 n=1 Tax=Diaphorina citri TaxID=121845 RepID=A0A3Q0JAE6_DIACI